MRVFLGSISILCLSALTLSLFVLNPSWSYANQTTIDFVTVHHNLELEQETEEVITEAIAILKTSPLYNKATAIDLCLNDDKIYPNLNQLYGQCLAFATLNVTTLKNCRVSFKDRLVYTKWAANNLEDRKFNLVNLLAHEFTHNLQNQNDFNYVFKSTLGK